MTQSHARTMDGFCANIRIGLSVSNTRIVLTIEMRYRTTLLRRISISNNFASNSRDRLRFLRWISQLIQTLLEPIKISPSVPHRKPTIRCQTYEVAAVLDSSICVASKVCASLLGREEKIIYAVVLWRTFDKVASIPPIRSVAI